MRPTIFFACFCSFLALPACSRSNNLLLGRVEAEVGGHTIAVTDCYRTSVPPPETTTNSQGGAQYRFVPCRDADVTISGEELLVNGTPYGSLKPDDAVTVDHGKVLINGHAAEAQPH